jgi:hypothetical protein
MLSFGPIMLTGPTHPLPSANPFFTPVGSANAAVHERMKAEANSTRIVIPYLDPEA